MEQENLCHANQDLAGDLSVRVLTERSAILAQRDRLRRFAVESHQPYALHWLPFYLGRQQGYQKVHSLVMIERQDDTKSLVGAALFLEHHPFGPLARIGMAEEVVAASPVRSQIVALAAETMIQQGLSAVILNYVDDGGYTSPAAPFLRQPDLEWANISLERKETMHLEPTFDETLRRMSTSARKNMRYYRSRFQSLYQPVFYGDACREMRKEDAIELTKSSKFPVSRENAALRYESSVTDEGFLMGLRLPDGHWASALGGWRAGDATVMQWQANSLSFERDSLVNVMRAYLIEHEVQRGCRSLTILGGTGHRMNTAFETSERVVFMVRHQSRFVKLMNFGASAINYYRRLAKRPPSTLGTWLANPTVQWHKVENHPPLPTSAQPALSR